MQSYILGYQVRDQMNYQLSMMIEQHFVFHPSKKYDQNEKISEIVLRTLETKQMNNKSSEEEKDYNDYNNGKLLNKVRSLTREVLHFYLGRELKDKQSFFFVLHQLKEY